MFRKPAKLFFRLAFFPTRAVLPDDEEIRCVKHA
jgi:hypothetical protein